MRRYLFGIGILITIFLFLSNSNNAISQSLQNNLWSVQFLWQQAGHPLRNEFIEINHPATHINGYLWMARTELANGDWFRGTQILQPIAYLETNEDLLRLKAEIALTRGDFAAAITLWQQIRAVDDLLDFAQKMSRQARTNVATDAYHAAYKIAPERAVLPFVQFLRHTETQSTDAEQLLHKHLTEMPDSRYKLGWLRELGTIYRQQHAWQNAQLIYKQLVTIAPDSIDDWIQLGWVYYEQGAGIEAALAQFQQAIALDPQNGAGYFATAYLLNQENRYAEADLWYQQALSRQPEEQSWWLSRAVALQKAGEQTAALKLYAVIQQRFPGYAYGHYQAAAAYEQAKEWPEAVNAIEQAIRFLNTERESSQSQAAYYARAGRIYTYAGQIQKAVTAYTKAQSLDPNRQDVKDGLQRLQS